MSRMKPALLAVLILALVWVPLLAQKPSVEDQWRTLNDELTRSYGRKDWPGALTVLDRMMKLADSTENGEARAGVFYMRACVRALAGQKTQALEAIRQALASGFRDYAKYSSDTDLDSLRGDPGFKALLAEIKAKYGPAPLVWDRTQPAPEFAVEYDDAKAPQFVEMRREFAIDAVVAGARDDPERLRRLARWVSTRWEHSPNQMASKSDPLTILREAQKGGRFICREYAIVMAGVAAAYGMPARVVNLLPRDVETRSEAHSVAEVWLEGLHKWVLADGQYGCLGELDGVPLNGIELQAAFAADRPVVCSAAAAVCAEWKPFILRNAYFFKVGNDQRAFEHRTKSQLVLVPMGAPKPTKFAGGNEEIFAGAVYTSNPDSFYAPPRR
jgi:transglutaminase-like putative cysteine protease